MPDEPRHELLDDIVCAPPFSYSPDDYRKKHLAFIEKAQRDCVVPVLSHERLSGYPATGGFDSKIIADRLYTTFPEAAILIVIREQTSMISSMYSQYITDGGDLSIYDFLNPPEEDMRRVPGFSFDFYKFDWLVKYYCKLFGRENILVLPYELLVHERERYIRMLADFCGLPFHADCKFDRINARRLMPMQTVQRWNNIVFSRNQLSQRTIFPISRANKGFARLRPMFERITPKSFDHWLRERQESYISNMTKGRYGRSNQVMCELLGIDLADYGYDVDKTITIHPKLKISIAK